MEMVTFDGTPYPLGISKKENGINFAVVSSCAKEMTLALFHKETKKPYACIPLSPAKNKTGHIWHILISGLPSGLCYAFQTVPAFKNFAGELLDPYAKSLTTTNVWGEKKAYRPLGELDFDLSFDWEGDRPLGIPMNQLIVYEMHVRAFTQHHSSQVKYPGTFLGLVEKIPYLRDLGINAVELMPIHEFNEMEYHQKDHENQQRLFNFWGYSTVNFFSPMNRYAAHAEAGAAIKEFKTLVKELHRNKIEVILDVVFNHTGEGNEMGPIFSFKGLDNSAYYIYNHGKYFNSTGCGNTVNANHQITKRLIIDALHYWVAEMHVDGFRFDLASSMMRGVHGEPLGLSPIVQAISHDPLLAKTKLIAEPWDIGLYQVGHFSPETKRWSEWNGKYRDGMRRFIKGTGSNGEFAMRLCGSEDLYKGRSPQSSINFIISHDGFTLADLVSYNSKHNEDNGEQNRDGLNENESWNCGEEGPTKNAKIEKLRAQQMRNFHLALMLSQGVPMLHMGDEYGHTKKGNNNTWCHDDELNWFLWDELEKNVSFYRYYKLLIQFRKEHWKLLGKTNFLHNQEIDWHGFHPLKPEWNKQSFIAFTLKDPEGGKPLYAAFNPQNHPAVVQLPPLLEPQQWSIVVDTSHTPPEDIYEKENRPVLKNLNYVVHPYSAILLEP